MAGMVVAVFHARSDAETARKRLLEHGFKERQTRVEGGEGAAGRLEAVRRAFAGLLTEEAAERYAQALRGGKSLVAVLADDEAAAIRATTVLNELIPLEVDKTLSRAEIYALPHSPVGWWESFEGEKPVLREFPQDPGRPEEHILDAGALGTEELRELAEKAAQQRGKNEP